MISTFLGGLESVFGWLLEASWQASVLAILVLGLQWLLREKLNPRWHHALWLLVIARLLLPTLPESALSLFQFAPKAPLVITQTVTEPIFVAPAQPHPEMASHSAEPAQYPLSAFTVLALIWLVGAWGLLLMTWQVNRRFARHVAAARPVNDPRLLKLAASAQEELGIHRSLRMIESAQVQSPAIMGLFRPTLILPSEVGTRFGDDELRFIFLHELAHLKRGDLFLQWVIALLQILHWFNPVLWYAFRRARIDREPATDALVLSCTGETQKESYGQVLVKLLEHHRTRYALPTLVGILEDKDQFKRRFSLIARFSRGAYGWSLLGVVIIAALAAVCLTKAKAGTPGTAPYDGAPVRIQILVLDAPDAAYHGPDAAEKALKSYEHFRETQENTDRAGYLWSNNPVVPREIGSSASHTKMGKLAGLNGNFPPPCPTVWCTPMPHDGKISITGTITLNTEDWSGIETQRKLTIKPVPGASYPINLDVNFQQLQPISAEGILEPVAAQAKNDKVPRRLFVFLSAWPESPAEAAAESATVAKRPTSLDPSSTSITSALVPGPTPSSAPHPDASRPDLNTQLPAALSNGDVADRKVQFARAAYSDDIPTLQKLLNAGVDPNTPVKLNPEAEARTPLLYAVLAGRAKAVAFLLDHGAKLQTALYWDASGQAKPGNVDEMIEAEQQGYQGLVKIFWDHGERSISELNYAITQNASLADVAKILDAGTPVDPPQDTCAKPLAVAAIYDRLDLVTLLLQRGAKVDKDAGFSNALDFASQNGDDAMVALLLSHGAVPHFSAFSGAGAAFKSWYGSGATVSLDNYEKIVRLLLATGAITNLTATEKGRILDATTGHPTLLKMLLDAGLSPELPLVDYQNQNHGTVLGFVRNASAEAPADSSLKSSLALLEAADKAEPKSSTSTQPNAPFQNVTISGKLQLIPPGQVNLDKSVGYLQSVDGGSIEFYFQPDGTFAVPNVKPGIYNRHIHFVPADPMLASEASDMTLAPLTIDGSAAQMTTNLNIAVGFAKPPKGNVEIGLKIMEISDDLYLANKAKVDAAVERDDIGFFNNMEGVSLLSAPTVSTEPGTKANIDIVREFPYPIKFDPATRVSNSVGATVTVPPTPTHFATKDVAISAEITPTINAADSPDPGTNCA